HLLIAAAGPIVEAGWSQEVRQADLFDVKGLVENLFAYLAIDGVTMLPHSGRSEVAEYALEIAHHDQPIGTVGRLAEALQNGYEIGGPVFFAEIDWQYISGQIPRHRRFQPVARFPVVERDIALIVSRELPAAAIIDTIRDAGQPLLQDVHLFDLYEGEGISEGNRSLAFSLRFGTDRTLTDREVDERMDAITARLEDVYGARLRR
ncbi:MAG: phenylalanine--tRNA ligase subunit beta, partial [Rhodothermales bacterium]